MGLLRLIFSAFAGAAIAYSLPRAALMAATQELIGFLALVMAGLLPAMILTATILRGDGFSAKRVEEYGKALQAQLTFWAMLFLLAGLATFAVVTAKVLSHESIKFYVGWGAYKITHDQLATANVLLLGACLGGVVQRLYPAYVGLKSLLVLNVSMAKAQALTNDRSLRDALEQEAATSAEPEAYAKFRTDAAVDVADRHSRARTKSPSDGSSTPARTRKR